MGEPSLVGTQQPHHDYLYVLYNVERDPVCRVQDQAQTHVGGGVVNVAQQVHGLLAPFGSQLSIELVRSLELVGCVVGQGRAGKQGSQYTFVMDCVLLSRVFSRRVFSTCPSM